MTTIFSRAPMLAVAALCLASPAVAKDRKPVDPDKKVCRSDIPTGSMMRKSVCHTVADWAQIDAAHAATTRSVQDQAQRSMQTNQ